MPLNKVFLTPPKLVSTKTLLLKHYYSRQGQTPKHISDTFGSSQTLLFQTWLFANFTQKRSFAP